MDRSYGTFGRESVNGLDVFAELLRARGHRVRTAVRMTPRLAEDAEVVVLFRKGDGVVPADARQWLTRWLAGGRDRHLILVPRDRDSAAAYYETILADTADTAEPLSEPERRHARKMLAQVQGEASGTATSDILPEHDYGLRERFVRLVPATLVRATPPVRWEGVDVDAGRVAGRLRRRLELGLDFGPLVAAEDAIVLARTATGEDAHFVGGGTVWVLADGALVTNFGLTDPDHRRLAVALARSVGEERRVVFVQRELVSDSEPPPTPQIVRLLTTPPLDWIAWHALAAALLYVLYRLPIFGRPRTTRTRRPYRFGEHVSAVGKLLAATGDDRFAYNRVRKHHEYLEGLHRR